MSFSLRIITALIYILSSLPMKGKISPNSHRPFTKKPTPREKKYLIARRSYLRKLTELHYRQEKRSSLVILTVSGRVRLRYGEAPAKTDWNLPFRVYADLEPCIPIKPLRYRAFNINGPRIIKIRVGRNTIRITRVVLELQKPLPYRIWKRKNKIYIKIFGKVTKKAKRALRWGQIVKRNSYLPPNGHNQTERLKSLRFLKLPFPFPVKRVAIDAGHGGREDGAISKHLQLREKDLTLEIAKKVVKYLRDKKIDAFLIRTKDQTLSLDQRVARIRKGKADILVSIHINSSLHPQLKGISTYFLLWSPEFDTMRMLSKNPLLARENQGIYPKKFQSLNSVLSGLLFQNNLIISRILALSLQANLVHTIRRHRYDVRDLGVRRGLFYLLFAANIPAVLVEFSFLSNPEEEKLLASKKYRELGAKGIAEGIAYFVQLSQNSTKSEKK